MSLAYISVPALIIYIVQIVALYNAALLGWRIKKIGVQKYKLSKHIDLAHQDVGEISTSAKKITQRFQKIEAVDLLIQE